VACWVQTSVCAFQLFGRLRPLHSESVSTAALTLVSFCKNRKLKSAIGMRDSVSHSVRVEVDSLRLRVCRPLQSICRQDHSAQLGRERRANLDLYLPALFSISSFLTSICFQRKEKNCSKVTTIQKKPQKSLKISKTFLIQKKLPEVFRFKKIPFCI
jgi:hypothetical protein